MTGFLDKLDMPRPVQQEISDRVIELWRQYQDELFEHGISARQAARLAGLASDGDGPGADTSLASTSLILNDDIRRGLHGWTSKTRIARRQTTKVHLEGRKADKSLETDHAAARSFRRP